MEPLRLSEIAALVGGELVGSDDPVITGAAGIDHAGPGDLTFVNRSGLLPALAASGAGAVLIGPGMEVSLPAVRCAEPYRAFAGFLARMAPDIDRVFPPGVHPTAVVDSSADVAAAAAIGPFCVIGAGVTLGEGTRLGSHVAIGPDVSIGRACLIYPHATVREGCVVGDETILHAGSVLGTEGFGYLPGADGLARIPQVGRVVIGNRVEIGAGSCIDRATTGATVVGDGSKIDNQIQIGHNVKVGRNCALSAQTGISGSCVLGDGVTAGGQVGIADHVTIGDRVKIGAKSGLNRDVPAGQSVFGYPALDAADAFRISSALRRLPELLRRVASLEKAAGKE